MEGNSPFARSGMKLPTLLPATRYGTPSHTSKLVVLPVLSECQHHYFEAAKLPPEGFGRELLVSHLPGDTPRFLDNRRDARFG